MWSVFWSLFGSIFRATWLQFGPNLAAKTLPKSSQVGSKMEPSWSIVLEATFWKTSARFFMILGPNSTWSEARQHCKIQCFLRIFGFSMFGCWVVFLIDFWLILGAFWGRKSVKKWFKIDPKRDRKQDASWYGFGMALGSIFGRFGAQVGGQVGAKLGPKSIKNPCRRKMKSRWASGIIES